MAGHSAPRSGHFRILMAILMMLALFIVDSMKMSLGMAMVCMVNSTAYSDHPTNLIRQSETLQCERLGNVSGAVEAGYTGHLLWTPQMQSVLFSAVFYSALATSLPSGYLADWFNPKTILSLALAIYTVTTLLSPLFAEVSYTVFLINRVLMGLGEGSTFPTITSIAARWFPAADRGAMVAIYTAGTQVAGIFSGITSSSLCQMDFLGGWPLIFYFYGSLGIVWLVAWTILASSQPSENRWISDAEEKYITGALQHSQRTASNKRFQEVPWMSIFTSPPFWAIGFAWFANNFAVAIIQAILPSYIRDVLQLDLKSNGLFTILPFITQLITKLSSGFISDHIKRRGFLGHTATCKLFQSIGSFGTAATFTALALFVDCSNPLTALFLLSLQGLLYTATVSGWATSLIIICPRYTGVVTSVGMLLAMLGSASSPALFGVLSESFPGSEYTLLLLTCAVINAAAGIFFLFFGSAKMQAWALQKTPTPSAVGDISLIFPTEEK